MLPIGGHGRSYWLKVSLEQLDRLCQLNRALISQLSLKLLRRQLALDE